MTSSLRVAKPDDPPDQKLLPEQRELVLDVLDLVKKLVLEICPTLQEADRDDAMGFGWNGAATAALRFDPTAGWRFSTYAYPYIAGGILDWLRRERSERRKRQHGGLRGAASMKARAFVAEAPDTFDVSRDDDETNHGRLRTFAERLIAAMAAGVSAAPPDPEESEMHRLTVIAVRDAFATMSEAERKIYRLHYGEDKTLKEIAKVLGVSYNTALRWHECLLDKIAARLNAEGVTELVDARVVVSEGQEADEGEG